MPAVGFKHKILNATEMGKLRKLALSRDPDARKEYYQFLADRGYAYGKLAGGVVQDDSIFGQGANSFAKVVSEDRKSRQSELDWQRISMDLMRADYKARQHRWNQDPDKPITLNVDTIRRYHSEVFQKAKLPKEAWTAFIPLKLAGREHEDALWEKMLSYAGQDAIAQGLGSQTDIKSSVKKHAERRQKAGDLQAAEDHSYWEDMAHESAKRVAARRIGDWIGLNTEKPNPHGALGDIEHDIFSRNGELELDSLGEFIRNRLDHDFARKMFTRYWRGMGDYRMLPHNYNSIVKRHLKPLKDRDQQRALTPDGRHHAPFEFEQNGARYKALKMRLYDTEGESALGSAWIVFDGNEQPVGLIDEYDFNPKGGKSRDWDDETKTWAVGQASQLQPNSREFTIRYGVTPEIQP